MNDNFILETDSYKVSHWRQYPPGTSAVFSYFESRGGLSPETVFYGLQYILRKHFTGVQITPDRINEARAFFFQHFGRADVFNERGWWRVLEKHKGALPLRIRAVPEGSVIPVSNVLMTVENTDPEFFWLTNYAETLLSQIWYPCTVATQSRAMRRLILGALEETGDPALIDFKVHDFGYRGSTSDESAGIGGSAHLTSFKGTDTMAALVVARDYYGEPMAGFSIPAMEHSTVTSWGRKPEDERAAYRNMLTAYPEGLIAAVSDSYDIVNAVRNIWGRELRSEVLARKGTVVIRPDSGDPEEIVLTVLRELGEAFGFEYNKKGYRVLNPAVRVIQGDGVDIEAIADILSAMRVERWSTDNIAFGSGGALLQRMDRDTHKFAFKCSAIMVDNVWQEVRKTPVTDPGKVSKAGRQALLRIEDGSYVTVAGPPPMGDVLDDVFVNGALVKETTFAEIRRRLEE